MAGSGGGERPETWYHSADRHRVGNERHRWLASRWRRRVFLATLWVAAFIVVGANALLVLVWAVSGSGVESFDRPCDIAGELRGDDGRAFRRQVIKNDNGSVCQYLDGSTIVVQVYANPTDRSSFENWKGHASWQVLESTCELIIDRQRGEPRPEAFYRLLSPRDLVHVSFSDDRDAPPLGEQVRTRTARWLDARMDDGGDRSDC